MGQENFINEDGQASLKELIKTVLIVIGFFGAIALITYLAL